MNYRTHIALRSRNAKTGPIPVTTTTAKTCPASCPFKGNGCYAQQGPLAMHWQRVTKGSNAINWQALCRSIAALPAGQLWRHNQAGDLPGLGDTIDCKALGQLVRANAGRRGFTYTHKPMRTKAARNAIAHANARGFTINLSANTLAHADQLASLGIAPVVVVLPRDATENTTTPDGRKVVICPATQRDDVTCASCGLCARLRDCIVGFPAHGTSVRKADAIARAAA